MQGTSAAVPSARPGKIGGMIGSMARNLLALALLAGCAAGCGLVDAVFDGFKNLRTAKQVRALRGTEAAQATGGAQ